MNKVEQLKVLAQATREAKATRAFQPLKETAKSPPSKAAARPKTSLALDAAFAVLLPKVKSSDGDVASIRRGHQAKAGSDRLADAGMAASPSDTNSGALQPRGEPPQTNATQPGGSPNIKRGRPRIGETRDKPWLRTEPPMSERTWYRRQAEKREGGK